MEMEDEARPRPNYAELFSHRRCLAIVGCTNAGKSTLATALVAELGPGTALVRQDDFYWAKERVGRVPSRLNPAISFYDYDSPDAVNVEKMAATVAGHLARPPTLVPFVVVEGNMVTELPAVFSQVEHALFLTLDLEACRRLRRGRVYEPPDEDGQFEEVVWPAYAATLARVKSRFPSADCQQDVNNRLLVFHDVSRAFLAVDELLLIFRHMSSDHVGLCPNATRMAGVISSVVAGGAGGWLRSAACGAQSIFIGTTREDTTRREGDGKMLTAATRALDYDAYPAMAVDQMRQLCVAVRRHHPSVHRVVLYHRTGTVPVGEPSVLVGTAAPHRRAALSATDWLVDELKRRVPIWKKEICSDGTGTWRANAEPSCSSSSSDKIKN